MEYLSLPNVLCVGGSWICLRKTWSAISAGTEIEQLAREASQLGQ